MNTMGTDLLNILFGSIHFSYTLLADMTLQIFPYNFFTLLSYLWANTLPQGLNFFL
jgi:hypothetical protein